MKKVVTVISFMLIFLTAGCATAPTDPDALKTYRETNDPLEPMNRKIFAFNMQADKYAMRPVVNGYRAITTDGFRLKVRTFLGNLKTPLTVVNDLLQLNFKNAGIDMSRFVINSTIGFLGVYDVAEKMGLPKNTQGFGTTLGVWGVPSGPYLVLPLLGPSNARDATGLAADIFFDPFTYVSRQNENNDITNMFYAADVTEAVATYENAVGLMDEGKKSALDFYAFMRSMHKQYRKKAIDDAKGVKAETAPPASYDFDLDNDDE